MCRKIKYGTFQKTNNKGADQTAQMRRLICACVVRKPPMTGFLASRPICIGWKLSASDRNRQTRILEVSLNTETMHPGCFNPNSMHFPFVHYSFSELCSPLFHHLNNPVNEQKAGCTYIWASTRENLSTGVCEQQIRRPACACAQSDQCLCYSLLGKNHT